MRDGNDILAANAELQHAIISNNGVYGNMSFVNLPSELSIDEVAAYIESDDMLSKCRLCLISIMVTDDEKRIGDSFVLHAPCDLHIYDGVSKRIVKSLAGLENVGIGSDRLQARNDLVGNQIGMLSKYVLELFGRLLDGIE
ncbi:MAG TPA: hypothetical protein DCO86_00470 [Spirochaetaceae bacterium]|nr:hypothetical protein [Spirochaetaceae bacterium]